MSEDTSFDALMERVRAGDELAAAEVVRRYERRVRREVRRRLNHHLGRVLDSADICQSVLANFFRRARAGEFDLKDPAQLSRLLVTMARHRLIDHARKPANRLPTADDPRLVGAAPGKEEPPAETASRVEILRRIHSLLTPDERDLADQRAVGRPWTEIAAERGDSPERLRKKLERALDRAAEAAGLAASRSGNSTSPSK
jgi:RNA polymerase sigma factor (sigma-70 family)